MSEVSAVGRSHALVVCLMAEPYRRSLAFLSDARTFRKDHRGHV